MSKNENLSEFSEFKASEQLRSYYLSLSAEISREIAQENSLLPYNSREVSQEGLLLDDKSKMGSPEGLYLNGSSKERNQESVSSSYVKKEVIEESSFLCDNCGDSIAKFYCLQVIRINSFHFDFLFDQNIILIFIIYLFIYLFICLFIEVSFEQLKILHSLCHQPSIVKNIPCT